MRHLNVALWASDEIARAGLAFLLGSQQEIRLVNHDDAARVDVMVLNADGSELATAAALIPDILKDRGSAVLIAGAITEDEMIQAISLGVLAVIPRVEATAQRLRAAVMTVAEGHGLISPQALGPLLKRFQLMRSTQRDLLLSELRIERRDHDVLRLLADGLDTAEIAGLLFCSERTIKYSLQKVTRAFRARNRTHAIASAIRSGLI